MSTTTLHDQTVRLFGVDFTIDIEVHWSRSLAPTHTHNGHGDPPTIEVDGFEIDEDEAFRIVVKERDALREKVRSLTDLLADAEAKIEGFNAAIDTEARR